MAFVLINPFEHLGGSPTPGRSLKLTPRFFYQHQGRGGTRIPVQIAFSHSNARAYAQAARSIPNMRRKASRRVLCAFKSEQSRRAARQRQFGRAAEGISSTSPS